MSTPRLQIRSGNPDFLDLPWELPVDDWQHDRQVEMPTGVHRHPVVFVAYPEGVYAIKELPQRLALKEYEILNRLEEESVESVSAAGLVQRSWVDPHDEQAAAVITRYVEHAFPYRQLLEGPGFGPRRNQMLDAVAGLLVELHLAGCYWGDCSLSNVLYRYDAQGIDAIMIDGETSEIHDALSDGQRQQDLEIMIENLAGEMADIAAMSGVEVDSADLALGEDIAVRYLGLWNELNVELVIGRDEGFRIRERIARLNELGFSVQDIEIEPSDRGGLVKMRACVGDRSFNSNLLLQLTGVHAAENQAKVILGDLNYYLAKTGMISETGRNVGTYRWLSEVFQPLVARIATVWHGDDPVQGYCDFLNHRMELARRRGGDVDNEEAFASWSDSGFPGFSLEE